MGLGGCYSLIKYLLVVFNFLFWLTGLLVVALAIWMLVDPTFYISMVQDADDYRISTYFLLIAGILLVIIGFLGCCGSFKESNCLLITFFSLLLVVVVAEISAGLWGYLNREALGGHVKDAMKHTVEKEYMHDANRRDLFDTFQEKLQCCGVDGPTDWNEKDTNLGVTSEGAYYNIPKSCCRYNIDAKTCDEKKRYQLGKKIDGNIFYLEGGYQKVMKELDSYFGIIVGVGIAILVVQVLGLIFALVLAFGVNRSRRYKA